MTPNKPIPKKTRDKALILLQIDDWLRAGETVSLQRIMTTFDIKRHHASKCMAQLRAYRPHIMERVKGRKKEWYADVEVDTSPSKQREAVALRFACHMLRVLEGTPHFEQLEHLAQRAEHQLFNATAQTDRMVAHFHHRPICSRIKSTHAGIVQELMRAMEGRWPCTIQYQRLDGIERSYKVQPWAWIYHRDELYLHAGKVNGPTDTRASGVVARTFRVDAIESVQLEQEQRFAPRSLDFQTIFQHSFGIYESKEAKPEQVHLQIRGRIAQRLKRQWVHASQILEPAQDGWYDLLLEIVPCPQLKAWILSQLPDIRVISPKTLEDYLRDILRLSNQILLNPTQ